MPAWQAGRHIGVKVVTVFPENAAADLPRLLGSFLLLDGRTGKPLALMDGRALTARRTAAASALAASYLARPDCERLLMVGTGALAPHLIEAHASVRPIVNVLVWGRHHEKAVKLAQRLNRRSLKVSATADLANAVRGAHIVCCATPSETPLIEGHWLPLGVHLDLVGGFRPEMREVDDDCIRRARVFVDTRAAALVEAGDIVQPLRSGVLRHDDIAGDLFDLARGTRGGRRYHDQITLFKSVGTALEDLAAAQLALDHVVN
jgi:ornithine cyclodeaminase